MGALPLFDLSGRTALVTGSSGGLGFAMVGGLAEAGARLVLNGPDGTRLEAAAHDLARAGHSVSTLPFDVADETAIQAAFDRLDRDGIAVDILVNNAGIHFRKPMIELAGADWRRVVDTNLTAAFLIGREAARRKIPRGGGRIINIGSVMSEVARATTAPYTAAKGGIKMLTRSMAAEWAAHNIQANAIGPGYIETEMNRALIDDSAFNAWVKKRAPAGRWGRPDELIGTAVFLASHASNYVNGQTIFVDGGMLAVL